MEASMAALAHFSFGFAAKRIAPKVPLGFLLVACGLIDIFAIVFPLIGIDANGSPPYWTHSLFMAVIWSLATAGITALVSRSLRASLVMGLLVFLHWVMDVVSWPMSVIDPSVTAGVPLFFQGSPTVGLGLYRTVFGVILGEGVMFLAGVAIYIFTLIKIKKEKKAIAQIQA
jgi:hypothetical protein